MRGGRSVTEALVAGGRGPPSPLTPENARVNGDGTPEIASSRSSSSWRMSAHSGGESKRRLRTDKSDGSPSSSPLTSRGRGSFNSRRKLEVVADDAASDYETCSSLENLTFDSDSDAGESAKENAPSAGNSLSARKKLRFGSKKSLMKKGARAVSPTRTPSENAVTVVETPPKRIGRETTKRRRRPNEESGPRQKCPRSDPPKARPSPFGDAASPTETIPAESFYSRPERRNESVAPPSKVRTERVAPSKEDPRRRRIRRTLPTARSHRRHPRKGEINRGVRHGIRKPKHNKKAYISKERALQLSVEIMENSPLNEFIELFTKGTPIDAPKDDSDHEPETETETETETNTNTSNNKFFKRRRAGKRAVIKLNHMKIQMRNGKLFYPKNKTERTIDPHAMHEDMKDLFEDRIEEMPEKSTIDTLINQWDEEEVPPSEPSIVRDAEEVDRNIERAEMLIQSGAVPAESSIDLHETGSNSADTAYVSDTNSVQNFDLLPVNGGYILVQDAEMTTDDVSSENLDVQIQEIDKNIVEIAKANNINPDILLSPTAQMCSMTSDLVLTSPKPASLNIRSFLEEAKANEGQKLFPLFNRIPNKAKAFGLSSTVNDNNSKAFSTSNKKNFTSLKDQYVIDAGQKDFDAIQCSDCGFFYQVGDVVDESDHQLYHTAMDVLKFQGWKNERLGGRWEEGRVIIVQPGDPNSHWHRVCDLLERVVNPQLGFAAPLRKDNKFYKVYLYIEKKLIVGCLVAEVIKEANQLIVDNGLICRSTESYPVKCGVSRLWTHESYRRRQIASRMLNSMRANFFFGHVLHCNEIAFSSPTPDGKSFAEKYFNTPNFYVYLD